MNAFVVQRLEDGLAIWLDRQRRAQDPARESRTTSMAGVNRELAEIGRELKRGPTKPELPTDLTDREKRMLGMPVEEGQLEGALGDGDEYADIDPEVLSVVEVLTGQKPYVPIGVRRIQEQREREQGQGQGQS